MKPLRVVPYPHDVARVGTVRRHLAVAHALGNRARGQAAGFRLFLGGPDLISGRAGNGSAGRNRNIRRALELII